MIRREDLVSYLKFVLAIGDTNDPILNGITDEQLEMILVSKSQQLGYNYPHIKVEEESILLCLARKEVYWKMATSTAPLYQLDLDGLKVAKEVRFDHYMELIREVDKEYQVIINDPKRQTVVKGEIIINKPYAHKRYINNYDIPNPILNVDRVTRSTFDLSIDYANTHLGDIHVTNIYLCTEPVWDKYEETINKDAKKVCTISSPKKVYARIKDVLPNTHYYILLEVCLKNGLKVYNEIQEVTPNE